MLILNKPSIKTWEGFVVLKVVLALMREKSPFDLELKS